MGRCQVMPIKETRGPSNPLRDGGSRDSGQHRHLRGTVKRLVAARRTRRKVAIHCRQSLGRAPLVAVSLLVRTGMAPDDARKLIGEHRQRSAPDTEEQREWVRSFAR
jgi:protein-tyrosine phosphatase